MSRLVEERSPKLLVTTGRVANAPSPVFYENSQTKIAACGKILLMVIAVVEPTGEKQPFFT